MTNINWDLTFRVSSSTLQPSPTGDLFFPTYGNYGGPNYSEGAFGGTPDIGTPLNPYLTFAQLVQTGDSSNDPTDPLDYLFYRHDVASALAGNSVTKQAAADLALLQGVVALHPETFDPSGEASLYAGFTTLGMLQELAAENQLSKVSPTLLFTALQDAVKDIKYGLEHLDAQELNLALTTIFHPDEQAGVFHFDFKVTTNSASQEYYEFLGMNALNAALDGGEAGNETILNTSGKTSWYNLTFDPNTKDLDLHAGHYDPYHVV